MKRRNFHRRNSNKQLYSLEISRKFENLKKRFSKKTFITPFKKKPFLSFFVVLIFLAGVIVLSNTLLKPKVEESEKSESAKKIEVFTIGAAPKLKLQAQVEKSKVIKIAAQSSGIIQAINIREGDYVTKGQGLIILSTNYQGGNALSIARQMAQKQYQNIKETFDLQKDLIAKQKEIASQTDTNNDKLREITDQSLGETRDLINLNQSIIDTLNDDLDEYEDNNQNGANDAAILQTKQLKSQFQAANNQLKASLRSAEFSANQDNAPAQLSNIQKDITIKQLELQEKSLQLSKEIAQLQLNLALVNEATMYPTAPYSGRIERIHVRLGQQVNQGTNLITFSGDFQSVNIYAKVSKQIADSISKIGLSTIHIKDESLDAYPDYISTEATDNGLYVIHFYLPEGYQSKLTDGGFVLVDIPIGYPDTSASIPFIPLDAVFQSQTESYIYIFNNGKAESKKVILGDVYGRFVQIKEGLKNEDQVILSRNIIDGESVTSN